MPSVAFSWQFSVTLESFLYVDILSLIFLKNVPVCRKWNRLSWKMEFLEGRTLLFQSKVPESLLVGGQCLDREIFCLKIVWFTDFSLKLANIYCFLTAIFVWKSEIELPPKTQGCRLQYKFATCFALSGCCEINRTDLSIKSSSLRIATLLLYSTAH